MSVMVLSTSFGGGSQHSVDANKEAASPTVVVEDPHDLSTDPPYNGHVTNSPSPSSGRSETASRDQASLIHQSNRAAPSASSAEQAASTSSLSSGPPATTVEATDTDLSSGKKTKVKKTPNKSKLSSSGAIATAASKAKGKRSASSSNNKRSHSDSSSNEDDSSADSDDEETESITSPRPRGRAPAKKATNAKSAKRAKTELPASDHDEADEEEEEDEEDEENSDESNSEEDSPKKQKTKSQQKRNVRTKQNNKLGKKKAQSVTKSAKAVKGKSAKKVESSEEYSDENGNLTEPEEDQNSTDAEVDEEDSHLDRESGKSTKNSKSAKSNNKPKKVPSKVGRPAKKQGSVKSKVSKSEKSCKKSEKVAFKKSANNQSDDDTEQSDEQDDDAEEKKESGSEERAQPLANPKSKCDKPKATSTPDAAGDSTSSEAKGPVKDVYTFELSPSEVPNAATARFSLSSSGHENKIRPDNVNRAEPSDNKSRSDPSVQLTCASTSAVSTPTMVPVKSSFSPKSLSNEAPRHEVKAFEPLRPDSYSHYEPPFGPNASLSSLSQLSQSIGGGAGPIMLNHQSSSNNKCSINIKEEPKEEAQASFRSLPHPKTSLHRTPPPVGADHLSSSQNYGANFLSSVNKNAHPRRLWSNASAGSLISSSSSSSSSPVHLAFGQCPPGPPTPATPQSLATYFTPSSSLAPSHYPPTNQELIRRELDSRILASAVSDRNLLPGALTGIPPAGGGPPPPPLAPLATQTPFNHAPSSPMIPATSSASPLIPSSASSLMPPNPASLYPISANLNSTAFLPGINMPIRPVMGMAPIGSQALVTSQKPPTPELSRPTSTGAVSKMKPLLASVEKGSWSTMHIRIAKEIYAKQKEKSSEQKSETNASAAPNSVATSRALSSSSIPKPKQSSTSSSRASELSTPLASVASQSSAPTSLAKMSSASAKNPLDTLASGANALNSVRPSSASNFNANYPPRYGTPFGASSISAPPMLPGMFPPSISSPMQLSGFLPGDAWPKPPLPVSMSVPISTMSSAAASAAASGRAPFMFPEYYSSANSASSALSAWAAGMRPPGDAFTPPNKHPVTESGSRPTASSSNSHGSHKRKHDDLEAHGKDRHSHSSKHSSSSSAYHNGELRSEQVGKKTHHSSSSSHKHHRSESSSSSSSGRAMLENGDRSRAESHSSHSSSPSKSSRSSHEPKPDNRYGSFNMAGQGSSVIPPPVPSPSSSFPATSALFGGSHPASFPPSEHQRYMELLAAGMAGPMSPNIPPPNSFMNATTATRNSDLSSRPLWPFGMPPPHSSSVLGSSPSMMPDPFKSLQDISLRPGLVTPDRENLFARYSMLNSSGGGASIFDKLSKEQIEKYEMLQGQGKSSQINSATLPVSKPSAGPASSDPSMPSSSRSTPTHRVSLPPPATSLPSGSIPPPATTPFPYPPPSYLSSLHHLGVPPPSSAYLPLGHNPAASFAYSNPMLNGMDSFNKALALAAHQGSMPPMPPGMPSDLGASSQFMLPPHFPPPPGPGTSMMNFLKPAGAPNNFSAR